MHIRTTPYNPQVLRVQPVPKVARSEQASIQEDADNPQPKSTPLSNHPRRSQLLNIKIQI